MDLTVDEDGKKTRSPPPHPSSSCRKGTIHIVSSRSKSVAHILMRMTPLLSNMCTIITGLFSSADLTVLPTTSGSVQPQTVRSSSSSSSHHASTSELNDAPGPSTSCPGSVPESMHPQRPSASARTATEGKTSHGALLGERMPQHVSYFSPFTLLTAFTLSHQMTTDPVCQVQQENIQARPCPGSRPAVSNIPPAEAPPPVTCL